MYMYNSALGTFHCKLSVSPIGINQAAPDPARDVKEESEIDAKMQREIYSDQSLNKASKVEMMSSKIGGEQNDENLVRQYAQVGEDANVDPDDDY